MKNGGITHSRFAVTPVGDDALRAIFEKRDFVIVENPHPEYGQGTSLALGVKAACKKNPKAILVCLADMPHITSSVLAQLCFAIQDADAAIFQNEKQQSPPAIFTQSAFDKLTKLQGDIGARRVLKTLRRVVCVNTSEAVLADIDTIEDLESIDNMQ